MSQLENAVVQRRPATSHREHGALRLMLLAAGGLLLSQMFAGYLFLWWIGGPPSSATPLTVVRYAYYFGDRPQIRRAVLICSALGIGGIGRSRARCTAMLDSPDDRNSPAQVCSAMRESCLVRPAGATLSYLGNKELRWLHHRDRAKVSAS
jgi:hypothetical protein